MKIIEIKERNQVLIQSLSEVWESSVKATHLFLSEDENGSPVGFMGIADKKLEMKKIQ